MTKIIMARARSAPAAVGTMLQPHDFVEMQSQGLDAREDSIQRGLILDVTVQLSTPVPGADAQRGKRVEQRCAQATADRNHISLRGGRRRRGFANLSNVRLGCTQLPRATRRLSHGSTVRPPGVSCHHPRGCCARISEKLPLG